MMQKPFDYSYLSTLAGATLATVLIIEFLKEVPGIKKVRTRILVPIVAFIVTLVASIFTQQFALEDVFLYVLNALLIASSAIGSWDTLIGRRKNNGK